MHCFTFPLSPNVSRFPNSGCSAHGGLNGTCYSEAECRKRQGLVAGLSHFVLPYPGASNPFVANTIYISAHCCYVRLSDNSSTFNCGIPDSELMYSKVAVLEALGSAAFSMLPVARLSLKIEYLLLKNEKLDRSTLSNH